MTIAAPDKTMLPPDAAALPRIDSTRLAPRPIASTERLLTEGGDNRIALEPGRGTNRYGCPPRPDAQLLAFGSSTASVISPSAYAAANHLRRELFCAGAPDVAVYAQQLDRVRGELIALCELSDLPGLDVIFGASGTDLHLISSQLVAAQPARLTCSAQSTLLVTVNAEETGSGVPSAMAGRHFENRSALGIPVVAGSPIDRDGGADLVSVSVSIRHADGTPRAATAIDAEIETLTEQAIAAGKRVLLVLVDVSKTGMIAPSPACAAALRERWPESVDVLVDACQFRIAPATLHTYLRQDFMVALTGSKFLTGPTFSGALLVPAAIGARLQAQPLPHSLSAYSCRADWPRHWQGARVLDDATNFGLVLRWEAALAELRALRAVPEHRITEFLRTFGAAIQHGLRSACCLEPLPTPPLARGAAFDANGWDSVPTIFPFLLYHHGPRGKTQPFSRAETAQVYRLLQNDLSGVHDAPVAALRCQLGQPVACGERDGIPVSALRICASARLVAEAASGNSDAVTQRALAAIDKTVLLASAGNFR